VPVSQGQRLERPLLTRLGLGRHNDRPIFVGGCPRSGTTLLTAMLHAHPELAMPPETRFVVESYQRRVQFGDLRDEANRRAVGEWIVGTKKTRFADLQLDPIRTAALVATAPPTIGSLSGAVLREFAARDGKRRWGDKRPKHIQHIRLIFRLFPDAQFIHLIRDARGCTASLKKLGWWGYEAPDALSLWRRSVESGIRAREFLRPDQYLELRYEDLVADPVSQLQRICAFLGTGFTPVMLQHHETGEKLIDKPYHERVYRPVDDASLQSWREVLEPAELALVEKKAGNLLDEFGYPRLEGLPKVGKDLEQRYTARVKRRTKTAEKAKRRHTKQREVYTQPVAARLTSGQRRLYWLLRLTRRA